MHTYREGQMLRLRVTGCATTIEARISKLLRPWTLSVVMIVDILATPDNMNIPDRAFLKLYDRRFATQVRSHWDMDDWSLHVEEQLLDFSRTGRAQVYLEQLRDDFNSDIGDSDIGDSDIGDFDRWGIPEDETEASEQMHQYAQTESKAYHSLRQHQGSLIPRVYAEVTFKTTQEDDLGESPELFNIPGKLIEYIDGFCLSDLARHTDQTEWNYLVNRAVDVTGEILNTSNVLNQDVRPENMMVCRDAAYERGYRLVMVDFGNCEFRENKTMEEWGRAKHIQDEERCMGENMKRKLKKQAGFLVEYKHENRSVWRKYAERE